MLIMVENFLTLFFHGDRFLVEVRVLSLHGGGGINKTVMAQGHKFRPSNKNRTH